jgi:3-dehydroquinate synthase
VERPAWAKIEVVTADEREHGAAGGRITLNLGHTVAHALEAVDGYATLLHGEAVGYGLRAAVRVGVAVGVTPPDRAARIERLLDAVDLGRSPLPYPTATVVAATGVDKKHAAGRLRWVLPTADGVVVRDDVPETVVAAAIDGVVAGRPAAAAEARA